jgi:hypothetical protein
MVRFFVAGISKSELEFCCSFVAYEARLKEPAVFRCFSWDKRELLAYGTNTRQYIVMVEEF